VFSLAVSAEFEFPENQGDSCFALSLWLLALIEAALPSAGLSSHFQAGTISTTPSEKLFVPSALFVTSVAPSCRISP